MVLASAGKPGLSRFPCPDFGGAAPPSFIGEDYFCTSGDEPEFIGDGENPLLSVRILVSLQRQTWSCDSALQPRQMDLIKITN